MFTKFKETIFPTCSRVLKHYFLAQKNLKLKLNIKESVIKDVSGVVSLDLKHVWQKASILTVSNQEIICLIQIIIEKYKNI